MTGPDHSGQIAQSSRIPVVVTNAVYRKLVRCRSRLLVKGLNAILDPVAQGPAEGALTPADQPMAEWPLENSLIRISVRYVEDRAEIVFLAPKFVLTRRPDPDRPRPGGASAILLRFNRTIAIGRIAFRAGGDRDAASLPGSRRSAAAGFEAAGRRLAGIFITATFLADHAGAGRDRGAVNPDQARIPRGGRRRLPDHVRSDLALSLTESGPSSAPSGATPALRPAGHADRLHDIGTRYPRRAPTPPASSSARSNCAGTNNAARLKSVFDGFGAGAGLFLQRLHEAGDSDHGRPAIGLGDAERLN